MAGNFRFRQGSRIPSGVKADAVAAELERICDRKDGLTPDDVIAKAKNPKSAMHPIFEWDDSEAAVEYRRIQARHLIRSVEIVRPECEPRRVYAHIVRASDEEGEKAVGVYQPIDAIVISPDMFGAALSKLISEVEAARESVRELQEAAEEAKLHNHKRSTVEIVGQHLDAASDAAKSLA